MSLLRTNSEQINHEAVVFNYQRPSRARLIALGSGDKLWLVEVYDLHHRIWVWQAEEHDREQAVGLARRLSLFPA